MVGNLQRAQHDAEDALGPARKKQKVLLSNSHEQSAFATCLLNKWAWGVLSAPDVQELAHAALCDGLQHPEISEIAASGAYGNNTGSIHRDLTAHFVKDLVAPAGRLLTVPGKDVKGGKVAIEMACKVVLPSDWLLAMASHGHLHEELELAFGYGTAKERFWDLVGSKFDHPAKKKGAQGIPLLVHGDGARFQDKDSLLTVSMSGLLKQGSISDTNLILASWPKNSSIKGQCGTWSEIWEWLVWDFNGLYHNQFPALDPFGNPLDGELAERAGKTIFADGTFFFLLGVQGDMEYLQNELGLSHWASDTPCHLCPGWLTTGLTSGLQAVGRRSLPPHHCQNTPFARS